jgi:hypothetical protein
MSDKQRATAAVSYNGDQLQDFPAFKDDYDVVITAVRQSGVSLQFASSRMCDDFDVVLAAVQNAGHALAYASTNLRMNKGICWAACVNYGSSLVYMNEHMRGDIDIALAAARSDGDSVRFLSEKTMENEEIALAGIRGNSEAVVYLRPQSRVAFPNGDLVVRVLQQNSLALEFMDARFRSDERTMDIACRSGNPAAARFADMSVPGVRAIVLNMVQMYPTVFYGLTDAQRDDDELAAVATAADPFNVLFASWRIQTSSRQLVLDAVSRNGEILADLPWTLQRQRDVVLAAAGSPGPNTSFGKPLLPEIGDFCKDRDVVIAFVGRFPYELTLDAVHASLHLDAEVIATGIVCCVHLEFYRQLAAILTTFSVLSSAVMQQLLGAGDEVRAYFGNWDSCGHVILKRILAGVPGLNLQNSEMQLLNAQVCCLLGHGNTFLELVPPTALAEDYDDAVAAVAKHCPELVENAAEVSARMHTPVDAAGAHTALHMQQRTVFDQDMGEQE